MMRKRLFDFFCSLLLLLILSPIYLLIYLCVRIKLGSPVLFKQTRPGLHEKLFVLYKFRTMTDQVDQNGVLLSDQERMTRFGRFLRASSMDELPQLWNVLKGDMSLIGPRALLVEYLPLYSPDQKKRHNVKPGITGLAQVSGRNAISWDERFQFDVFYVQNHGLIMDIKILLLTVIKVLNRSGISAKGDATMSPFKGQGD